MAYDDQDDLFVDDFDFLDEDEEDTTKEETKQEQAEAVEEKSEEAPESKKAAKPRRRNSSRNPSRGGKRGSEQKVKDDGVEEKATEEKATEEKATEEKEPAPVEEPKEPPVPTDHVVHVYECGKFVRTIKREFSSDDAEAFAVEYNRTSNAHSRQGVVAGRDDKPAEAL